MKVGFSRESRTTSLKEFSPNSNHLSGLCAGVITNISVGEADFTNSKSEFWTGHKVPRLVIQFQSKFDPDGVKPSYYTESFMPPSWTPDLLPDGKMSFRIGSDESKLGHILEAIKGPFVDEKAWSDEEMAQLTTDLELATEDGEFIPRDPEEVAEAYKKFYSAIVAIIENEGKPLYRDANGKSKAYWLKLLYTVKGSPVNNGKVGFPNYADTGFIEEVTYGANKTIMAPNIKIQLNKQESIDPDSVKAKERKKPNMRGVVMGGANVQDEGEDVSKKQDIPDWMNG